ncbi:MAG: DUF459 domain-containing protein [Pseudomonadota bacterium]
MRKLILGAVIGLASLLTNIAPVTALEGRQCPNEPMRVLVLGDSLADGLWASLHRFYARCNTLDVVRLTTVSDGLAKTSEDEWAQRFVSGAGGRGDASRDVVIVQMGANDITYIRNGRTRESFNTEEWQSLYHARVKELTRVLRSRSAEVYWFGLPIVGNTKWEPSYRIISELQRNAVRKAGGNFIDIHELTMFGTGTFAMNARLEGRIMQMRAADKVHFTKPGYDYVASQVLDEIAMLIDETNRGAALQDVELQ